ncbi:MAG: ATP-binding protein [Dehalococcoidia bacterium]|nr:ATP-binding protein [Dehalococcoidia bacterium]
MIEYRDEMVGIGQDPEYFILKRAHEVLAGPSPAFVGHDPTLRAGCNLCQHIADPATSLSSLRVLISGWPGGGKTVFPGALVSAVNKGSGPNQQGWPYGYVLIKCARMATSLTVGAVLNRLEDVESFLRRLDSAALVTFDELDALAPGRSADPALLRLTMWVMQFLEAHPLPVPTVILGITNDPLKVDMAVRDRFQADLYFSPLDDSGLRQILDDHGVREPGEVLKELHQRSPGCLLTGRTIGQAVEIVSDLIDVKTAPPKEIADLLFIFVTPVDEKEIREYERDQRHRMEKSRLFIRTWDKQRGRPFDRGGLS